jgi:hypothetical protein
LLPPFLLVFIKLIQIFILPDDNPNIPFMEKVGRNRRDVDVQAVLDRHDVAAIAAAQVKLLQRLADNFFGT